MNKELSPALDAGVKSLTEKLIIWLIRLVYMGGKNYFRNFGVFLVVRKSAGKRLGFYKSPKEAANKGRNGIMEAMYAYCCFYFAEFGPVGKILTMICKAAGNRPEFQKFSKEAAKKAGIGIMGALYTCCCFYFVGSVGENLISGMPELVLGDFFKERAGNGKNGIVNSLYPGCSFYFAKDGFSAQDLGYFVLAVAKKTKCTVLTAGNGAWNHAGDWNAGTDRCLGIWQRYTDSSNKLGNCESAFRLGRRVCGKVEGEFSLGESCTGAGPTHLTTWDRHGGGVAMDDNNWRLFVTLTNGDSCVVELSMHEKAGIKLNAGMAVGYVSKRLLGYFGKNLVKWMKYLIPEIKISFNRGFWGVSISVMATFEKWGSPSTIINDDKKNCGKNWENTIMRIKGKNTDCKVNMLIVYNYGTYTMEGRLKKYGMRTLSRQSHFREKQFCWHKKLLVVTYFAERNNMKSTTSGNTAKNTGSKGTNKKVGKDRGSAEQSELSARPEVAVNIDSRGLDTKLQVNNSAYQMSNVNGLAAGLEVGTSGTSALVVEINQVSTGDETGKMKFGTDHFSVEDSQLKVAVGSSESNSMLGINVLGMVLDGQENRKPDMEGGKRDRDNPATESFLNAGKWSMGSNWVKDGFDGIVGAGGSSYHEGEEHWIMYRDLPVGKLFKNERLVGLHESHAYYPRDRNLTGLEIGIGGHEWEWLQREGLLSSFPLTIDAENGGYYRASLHAGEFAGMSPAEFANTEGRLAVLELQREMDPHTRVGKADGDDDDDSQMAVGVGVKAGESKDDGYDSAMAIGDGGKTVNNDSIWESPESLDAGEKLTAGTAMQRVGSEAGVVIASSNLNKVQDNLNGRIKLGAELSLDEVLSSEESAYAKRLRLESKIIVTMCGVDGYIDTWNEEQELWRVTKESNVIPAWENKLLIERKFSCYEVEGVVGVVGTKGLYEDSGYLELVRRLEGMLRPMAVGRQAGVYKRMALHKSNRLLGEAREAFSSTERGALIRVIELADRKAKQVKVLDEMKLAGVKALPHHHPIMRITPIDTDVDFGEEGDMKLSNGQADQEDVSMNGDSDEELEMVMGVLSPRNPDTILRLAVIGKRGMLSEWPLELEELRRTIIGNGLMVEDADTIDKGCMECFEWGNDHIICAGLLGTFKDMGLVGLLAGLTHMGTIKISEEVARSNVGVRLTYREGERLMELAKFSLVNGKGLVGFPESVLGMIQRGPNASPWAGNIRYRANKKLRDDFYCPRVELPRVALKFRGSREMEKERAARRASNDNGSLKEGSGSIGRVRYNESFTIVAVGGGVFSGQVGVTVVNEWEGTASERLKQLCDGVTITLNMAGRSKEVCDTGTDPVIVFGGRDGLVHTRTEEDKSGMVGLRFEELTKLAGMESIVMAYYLLDGGVRIRTIVPDAFVSMKDSIVEKLTVVSLEMGKWGGVKDAGKVSELEEADRMALDNSVEELFVSKHMIISNIRMDDRSRQLDGLFEKIIKAATRNIVGLVFVDEEKLKERLEFGVHGMVRAGDLGMDGCDASFSRYGVLVELLNEVEVGSGGNNEIKVTDRNKVTWGTDQSEEFFIRQFVGAEEAIMFVNAAGRNTDYVFAGVRYAWRRNEIDDYIRWSLKKMWEQELGAGVFVWMWTFRHKIGSGKSKIRDEIVFMLLSSGGNGAALGRSVLKCGSEGSKWAMSVNCIGLELFTKFDRVKDTIFNGVEGTQRQVIELDGCPGRLDHREALDLVGKKGVSKALCVIRRNMRTLGEKESRWFVMPVLGELLPRAGEVERGMVRGLEWTMTVSSRDSNEPCLESHMIPADIVWLMGDKLRWELVKKELPRGGQTMPSPEFRMHLPMVRHGTSVSSVTISEDMTAGAEVMGEELVTSNQWVTNESLKRTLQEASEMYKANRDEDIKIMNKNMDERFDRFEEGITRLFGALRNKGDGGENKLLK